MKRNYRVGVLANVVLKFLFQRNRVWFAEVALKDGVLNVRQVLFAGLKHLWQNLFALVVRYNVINKYYIHFTTKFQTLCTLFLRLYALSACIAQAVSKIDTKHLFLALCEKLFAVIFCQALP